MPLQTGCFGEKAISNSRLELDATQGLGVKIPTTDYVCVCQDENHDLDGSLKRLMTTQGLLSLVVNQIDFSTANRGGLDSKSEGAQVSRQNGNAILTQHDLQCP